MKKIYLIPILLLCNFLSAYSQPVLIGEIPKGSFGFAGALGNLFFFHQDSLWRYDGATLSFVKDLEVPAVSSQEVLVYQDQHIFELSSTFYFASRTHSTDQFRLWRSDGSSEGTYVIASTNMFKPLGVMNNEFYYATRDGLTYRLYKVGNSGDPVSILDIDLSPFPTYSIYHNLYMNSSDHMVVDNNMFFRASTASGYELWKTNGTTAGTVLVKTLHFATGVGEFTNVNDILFFTTAEVGAHKLWKSDGTEAGTIVLKEFSPDTDYLRHFTAYNGKLYFIEHAYSFSDALYVSDGTVAGTTVVKQDLGLDSNVPYMGVANNLLYIVVENQGFPEYLWRSNGTTDGTVIVKTLNAWDTKNFTPVGDYLFYSDHEGSSIFYGYPENPEDGYQVWKSDLTTANTRALRNIYPSTSFAGSDNLLDVYGILYFTTYNPDSSIPDSLKNFLLWKYDPTGPVAPLPCFTLVDSDTDMDLYRLKNNDTITLSTGDNINIRYDHLARPVNSVVFRLNGKVFRVESQAPFAMAGDHSGDYLPWLNVKEGAYTLEAKAYTGKNGKGKLQETYAINFYVKVVPDITPTVTEFVLINAQNNTVIRTIENNAIIDLSLLPTQQLNIAAITNTSAIGSVRFNLNNEFIKVENAAPYALYGDNNGNYNAKSLQVRNHTLTATPYSQFNAGGFAGGSLTVNFQVVFSGGLRSGLYGENTSIACYPNPSSDYLIIEIPVQEEGDGKVELIDETGRIRITVFAGRASAGTKISLTQEVSDLPKGLYILHAKFGNVANSEKILIK
jgi:ELWxxDGT repeat protein